MGRLDEYRQRRVHLADRDRHIGWDDIQRGRRLNFIGQNNRLVVLADPQRYPNLVSRTMRLMTRRVSGDWQAQYGHPLFGLETFVDPQYFQGTCYKASGWRALGKTKGYGRSRKDFYQRHDRPKELYWRELNRKGLKQLARKNLPERYQPFETDYRLCPLGAPAQRSLFELFAGVNDPRKRQGRRYPLQTLLTIIAMATACGMKGHRAIASFASHLTTTQRRVLRCPKDKHTGEYRSPRKGKRNCGGAQNTRPDAAVGGAVVTGDAINTQQEFAHTIVVEKRGHYLWWLKDNQPTIRQTAEGLLSPRLMGQPHFETVASVADRVETHQIWCRQVTAEQIGFAAARQIFAIRRIVEPKSATAKASDDISYGITPSKMVAQAASAAGSTVTLSPSLCSRLMKYRWS